MMMIPQGSTAGCGGPRTPIHRPAGRGKATSRTALARRGSRRRPLSATRWQRG